MVGETEVTASPASVLLVDDAPANLLALSAVLKPLGARIVEARSGAEALEHIRREPFAVVLLDVQMPEMDGFEVASKLRELEHGRELPILFITAIHRDERYQRKGYTAGAADYITKPFDAEIVRARVKAFVQLFEQREVVRRQQVGLRTRERDDALRQLIAFEKISTAALRSKEVNGFLKDLLDIFVGAAEVADSGMILLADGDLLSVAACVGRNEEVEERFTIRVGEGVAGRVAAQRTPIEIDDAQASGEVKSQWLRARGTKALLSVPLLHDGELLGVAQIGSMAATAFPESDRRLLAGLAERAAWAIATQLRRSRLVEVLSAAPAVISIVRLPSLEYEFANPAWCALFNQTNVTGLRATDVGLGPPATALIRKAYLSGAGIEADEIATTIAGTPKFYRFTARPLRNHAGNVDSVLTFAVDVTAQVAARSALEANEKEREDLLARERSARTEAELANRAKDDFLGTISHELRTPLNAILGWATITRQKAPPELERGLEIIERNARAQSRMIEDVIDITRIVSGKLVIEQVAVDVATLIKSAAESMRPLMSEKEISFHLAIPDLPAVRGDAVRLQQVLLNVLGNAIKFTPPRGRVEVRAFASGASVTIEVVDTGQGIDSAFLPHVFDAFKQADSSTSRRHGGLGLGLAIVKQLVTAHGGQVTVSSRGVGHGARVVIELPQADRDSGPVKLHSAPPPSSKGNGFLGDLKVLVVDDDMDARDLVEEILVARGAEVTLTGSASEALDAVARLRPDVLISDIAMPGGDGYGLIRAVRSLPPERGGKTPAVAVTAHARLQDSDRAYAAGFQRHLTKPIDITELVRAVANLAGRSFGPDEE